jgi:multidrug resistance efflux pump
MRTRLADRRVAVIAVAAVVVIVLAGAGVWLLTSGNGAVRAKPSTAVVKRGTLTVTASAAGTVTPVNSRALTFGASGTVASVTVKAGDRVTTGEVLATIDPGDAQAAVTSAQSALDAANTNLSLVEAQSATPTATATACTVGAAYLIAAPSPSASASPTPSPSPPPPGHSTSPSPRPSASTPHSTRPPGGRSCGSGGGGGSGGGNGGGGQQSTGSDPLLRAQQAVYNAELALEQAKARLAGTTIAAPADGRVLSVAGSVGQSVSAGGSGFIVVGGMSSMVVQANFSEADMAGIQIGQPAIVTLANHPGTSYPATVTEIDPAGTLSGQLVRYGVQLSFRAVPADLLLGRSADVAVTTASATGVMYVPTAALTRLAGTSATVTVHTASGNVPRSVMVGLEGDQGTEIMSGLNVGDTVVIGAQ